MGVCLGIHFNVFTLTHTFGFDSLLSEWNAPICFFFLFLSFFFFFEQVEKEARERALAKEKERKGSAAAGAAPVANGDAVPATAADDGPRAQSPEPMDDNTVTSSSSPSGDVKQDPRDGASDHSPSPEYDPDGEDEEEENDVCAGLALVDEINEDDDEEEDVVGREGGEERRADTLLTPEMIEKIVPAAWSKFKQIGKKLKFRDDEVSWGKPRMKLFHRFHVHSNGSLRPAWIYRL